MKFGSQCGYCTPDHMASAGLLRRNPRPTEDDIRAARQQHLSLHRLCEDHRGGAGRRRAARAREPP
jgi:aerobic-type carbon monoxide dehydrogenase small subunit (CoxS/CutS family)